MAKRSRPKRRSKLSKTERNLLRLDYEKKRMMKRNQGMATQVAKQVANTPSSKFTLGIPTDSFVTASALCLCAYKDGTYRPSGTAVFVESLLAMTARHVVEDYLQIYDNKIFHRRDVKPEQVEGTFHLMGIHHQTGATWKVSRIFFLHDRPDIAFLQLIHFGELSKHINVRSPVISLLPPKIGEKIYAFGYVETGDPETQKDRLQFGSGEIRYGATSVGEVVEVYEERRDLSMLNFPCFQSDTRFDGGMSGGPVFNEDGKLIGLVCTNLLSDNIGGDHVSYCTLLWPAMLIPISISYRGFESKLKYPALFLAQKGIIKAEGWQRCHLEKDETTGKYITIGFAYS